jgi:hypothetical protein
MGRPQALQQRFVAHSAISYGESDEMPMMSAIAMIGGPKTACVINSSSGKLSGTTKTAITCLLRARERAGPLPPVDRGRSEEPACTETSVA